MTTVTIVGNISEPKLTFTPGGKAVCNFSVASNDRKKVGDEWEDDVTWYKVAVWEKAAENVAASFQKGSRALVYGTLKNREYEAEGKKGTSLEIQAIEVGPALRWATATVVKNEKEATSGSQTPSRTVPAEDPF